MEGRVRLEKFVPLKSGEKKKVEDFIMPLAAAVEGLVVDEFGVPVEGADISTGVFGSRIGSGAVKSDKQGHYLLKGIQPGANRVIVDAKGFALAFQRVELAVGSVPTKVDFTLSSGREQGFIE